MVKICRVIRTKLSQLIYENVRIIAILLRKCRLLTSEQQTFRRACHTKWRKTADMKKLRHCHPMYKVRDKSETVNVAQSYGCRKHPVRCETRVRNDGVLIRIVPGIPSIPCTFSHSTHIPRVTCYR